MRSFLESKGILEARTFPRYAVKGPSFSKTLSTDMNFYEVIDISKGKIPTGTGIITWEEFMAGFKATSETVEVALPVDTIPLRAKRIQDR